MSVLIKGMEMPKSCAECPMGSVFAGYKCLAKNKQFERYALDSMQDWCPLVEIPPHCRLIDADLLGKILKERAEDEWNKNTSPFSWSYAYECLMDTLNIMPTIIEAEEGD